MWRHALVALVLMASCSSGDIGVASPLDFSAPTVGGGELDLSDYAGSDVALWFWAPF